MQIAHLSDIHALDRDFSPKKWINTCLAVVNSPADLCIISGDLSDNAKPQEFEAILPGLDWLSSHLPILLVPGNHDGGFCGIWYTKKAYSRSRKVLARYSIDSFPHIFDLGGYRFICLDTVGGLEGIRWRLARGQVGPEQLAALDSALNTSLKPVVIMHHHPFFRGLGLELIDTNKLWVTLAARFHAIFFGHKHSSERGQSWFASGKTLADMSFRLVNLETLGSTMVRIPRPE